MSAATEKARFCAAHLMTVEGACPYCDVQERINRGERGCLVLWCKRNHPIDAADEEYCGKRCEELDNERTRGRIEAP